VDLGTRKDCLEVPERAVVELQGKTFLWVIDQNGNAGLQKVEVGEQNGSNIIILDGLKPGDSVVVEGLQKVRKGAPVNARKATPAAVAQPAKE
jgi:multidrug efflux pump subunit AcrA (membrane-fusion protein)